MYREGVVDDMTKMLMNFVYALMTAVILCAPAAGFASELAADDLTRTALNNGRPSGRGQAAV